jgi:hypothetical protein
MSNEIDRVQLQYASLLSWLVRVGLALMFLAFAAYAIGIVPSRLDLRDVPDRWTLSSDEYIAQAGIESGWGWTGTIDDGRTLAFASLVVFPAGTMILIAIAVLLYLKDRSWIYAIIAGLETLVLVVAATGIISGGH